jgi:hypothetical protein
MFTEEEIAAAKNVKKEILKPEAPEELKSLYMSGEICMWDDLQAKNLPQAAVSGSVVYENTMVNKTFSEKDMWDCWNAAKHFFTGKSQPLNFNEWLRKHYR